MWTGRLIGGIIFLSLAPSQVALATLPSCLVGRFLVLDGKPFLPEQGDAGIEVVTLAPSSPDVLVSLASGCPPRPAKIRQTGAVVRLAAHWRQCNGAATDARLLVIMPPDCSTMAGTFTARHPKVRRSFNAPRSRCGDGFLDVARGEQCDIGHDCRAAVCTVECACYSTPPATVASTSTTSTTALSLTSTTTTTATTSTAPTTTVTTTTSTTTTATTTTTLPAPPCSPDDPALTWSVTGGTSDVPNGWGGSYSCQVQPTSAACMAGQCTCSDSAGYLGVNFSVDTSATPARFIASFLPYSNGGCSPCQIRDACTNTAESAATITSTTNGYTASGSFNEYMCGCGFGGITPRFGFNFSATATCP